MRQIFFALPYVCPREPARIADLIRAHGTLRKVAAGGVLKRGGDANRLFLLEEGICAYFVAGATTGHSTIMSLLLPGTTLCDMTSSVGRRCNVETRAVQASRVWCTAPDFYERHVFTNPELAVEKYQHAVGKQEATLEGMIANFTLPPEQRVKILLKAVLMPESAPTGCGFPMTCPQRSSGRPSTSRARRSHRQSETGAVRDLPAASVAISRFFPRSSTTSTTGSSIAAAACRTGTWADAPFVTTRKGRWSEDRRPSCHEAPFKRPL